MRRLFQLLALVSVIGGMALLAGCQKENWGRKGSAKEVKFGAMAHSSIDTRTEYMDYDQTKDYQNIKWLATDKIRIYSPDAARRNAVEAGPESTDNPYYYWADYQIVPDGSDPTKGTLKNLSNDGPSTNPGYDQGEVGDLYDVGNGLVWLNGNQATFYGVYPRSAVSGKNGSGSTVADGKFEFTIPASQAFSEKGDMDYAFMTAATTASQGNNVTLNFFPDFTAFEISIKCEAQGSDVTLNSFTIGTHSTQNYDILNGKFTVDLSGDQKSYTIPTSYEASRKKITVSNINQTIPAGPSATPLVFTVFALPDLLRDLYVEFNTTTGGAAKTWKLDLKKKDSNNVLQPISFAAGKKHRIYGLALPTGELLISVNTAPWLAGGEDTYTTIENVTTIFKSYKRYNENKTYGPDSWSIPNYVAIAPGRTTDEYVDPDADPLVPTNRPLYSPMLTLNTVSVGVPLQLRSDNEKVGFVVAGENGAYGAPTQTLDIRASEDLDDIVVTTYFVVPLDDTAIGEVANISLVRNDEAWGGVPIAYSHSDMPGTTDHKKVPFMVLSVGDYNTKTNTEVPSI